jgi:hypothetical protein
MRYLAILVLVLASTTLVFAQGPCTEAAVKEGKVQLAKDAFSYMPPFGKPVTGKQAIQDTAEKKFAGRTNIKHSWESQDRGFGIGRHGIRAWNNGHELRRRW